jgi:hypothetical protein
LKGVLPLPVALPVPEKARPSQVKFSHLSLALAKSLLVRIPEEAHVDGPIGMEVGSPPVHLPVHQL